MIKNPKPKLKREYFGADVAADLVVELNRGEQLPLKLNEMLSQIRSGREGREVAINEMNYFLAGYAFIPSVTDITSTSVEFDWLPGYVRRVDGTIIDGDRSPYLVNLWLKAARLGVLPRIRQCTVCSRWYFAKFSHSRYDTVECRNKAIMHDDERHEDKKAYERRYYKRRLRRARKSWRTK